ncbi:carboxylate--amine ligase [Halostella salina]|uniref:carboxylate--amine ligase n=1 Tax=Halostella salina TaxID=1547897 RepID=UPI000EF7ED0C|nr:ATP-grasp domain-containing protein [Halostella salina]
MGERPPRVMVLDGDFDNAIQVATELSTDLNATVVGVGTSPDSRLLRSTHCDIAETVATTGDGYPTELLTAADRHRPDVVVPVGYRSVTAMDEVREQLPDGVACCLPPSDSLAAAVDKRRTLALADDLGIDTPADFSATLADAERTPAAVRDLPFPLFLKAGHESGENVTAVVEEPREFWPTYEDLDAESDDVLVQEYVGGSTTYACGALFLDGAVRTLFEHEERRSIPRQGGSGTRVGVFRDPELEAAAIRLLRELDWHGFALVEFKRRDDGSYALMEVNPKLWASYALASQAGYRFVSTMVAALLGLDWRPPTPDQRREMVFPLRELDFARRDSDGSVPRAALSMLWPPARPDFNLHDYRAWFTPPADGTDPDDGSTEADPDDESTERAANIRGRVEPLLARLDPREGR